VREPLGAGEEVEALRKQAQTLYGEGRYSEALGLFEQVAARRPSDGQLAFFIAHMYWAGVGTEKNPSAYEQWLERGAEASAPRACFYLAGVRGQQGREDEERRWLERAVSLGYAPAMYYLGRAYEVGRWGLADRRKALAYLEQAASKGNLFAKCQIAKSWLRGERGLLRIPLGGLMLVKTFWQMWMLLTFYPEDERILR
jgi:TPR repeat protein